MSQQYSRWQDLQQQPGVDAHVAARRAAPARPPVRHRAASVRCSPTTSVDETSCAASCRSRSTRRSATRTIALSAAERAQLIQDVTDDTLGYGPIDRFLHDPGITEVMVNGPKAVYIERRGKIEPPTSSSSTKATCAARSTRSSARSAGASTRASPMVDARLPDGSRVNAVDPPGCDRRPVPHDPAVLQGPVHGRRPHQLRLADAAGRALPRRVRARRAQHGGLRRYRYR